MSTPQSILVVDDHPASKEALSFVLKNRGYQVVAADTAGEATAVSRQCSFDIAIVDISLPDKSGWELVSELRSSNPELRAIAITGLAYENDKRRSLDAGFELHLTKPIHVQALEAALTALGQRCEQRASSE